MPHRAMTLWTLVDFFYFTFLQTLLKGNNEKNNKVFPLRNSLHLKINFNSDDVLGHNSRNH